MLERIEKVLREYKGSPDLEITLETTFQDLEFDSLDVVELIMNLEDEFGVELEMDENIKTIGDLASALEGAV